MCDFSEIAVANSFFFFGTFPQCSLPSTLLKNTIKRSSLSLKMDDGPISARYIEVIESETRKLRNKK